MIQTDLCSYSYKKGTLVPLCKKCGAQQFYAAEKMRAEFSNMNAVIVAFGLFGQATCRDTDASATS